MTRMESAAHQLQQRSDKLSEVPYLAIESEQVVVQLQYESYRESHATNDRGAYQDGEACGLKFSVRISSARADRIVKGHGT